MSDDDIAEIRARHEQVPSGNLSIAAISLAHADRATLLAEVDRLRAEIERLKQEPELLRAELISLDIAARKALADSNDRARDARWKASHERARYALEGKP